MDVRERRGMLVVGWVGLWVGVCLEEERDAAGRQWLGRKEGQSGRRQLGKALGIAGQGRVCFGYLPA